MREINVTVAQNKISLQFTDVEKEVPHRSFNFKIIEILMLLFIVVTTGLLKRIIFDFLFKQKR